LFEFRDAAADVLDDTRRILARRVWKLRSMCVVSASQVSIHRINTGGLDFDKHLGIAGIRRRHIFELHHLGLAVFVDNYCFHFGKIPLLTKEGVAAASADGVVLSQ